MEVICHNVDELVKTYLAIPICINFLNYVLPKVVLPVAIGIESSL